MKYKKICKCCGEEFETNSPQKIYCDRPHYLPCPICGKPVLKPDNDFTRPAKCCSSECTHKLRQQHFKKRRCVLCGEAFTPKSGVDLVCDKTHYQNCEICGKQIVKVYGSTMTTCSNECLQEKLRRHSQEKYGTDHPMQSKEVKDNFKAAMKKKYGVEHALQYPKFIAKQQIAAYHTNMEHNGVPYAYLLPQCMDAQGKIVSNLNRKFAKRLSDIGLTYSFEKHFSNDIHSYDICIESIKTLIEIDPSYTHNAVGNHWGPGLEPEYHLNKTMIAENNGYRCIHVFDWDDWDKIIDMLQPRKHIYARECTIYKLLPRVGDEFLCKYHLQGTCRGQLLYLGLVKDGELYQVMTFGKSRYDKSYDVELLRLCTKPGFSVVGGASKLFHYVTKELELHNIISYCDQSKFTGDVYTRIGMQRVRTTPPQIIWSQENKKITANLLRSRGYDQLFKTNYGKGTSNELLMLQNGWLPVYDCGQKVYEFI